MEVASMYLELTDLEAAWFMAGVFRLLKLHKLFLKLLKLSSSPSEQSNPYLKTSQQKPGTSFSRCGFASILFSGKQDNYDPLITQPAYYPASPQTIPWTLQEKHNTAHLWMGDREEGKLILCFSINN